MDEATFFINQDDFRNWLEEQRTSATELWVGYFRKDARRPSLTWSETVDVALCHGWIDGVRKTIDDQSYKIRFTPRKTNSVWSAVNVKKVERLIKLGKMKPEGLRVFHNRSDVKGYSSDSRRIPLGSEYEAQIMENQKARDFLSSLAPSYKRDSVWWVMSAKREETRQRRLEALLSYSEAGRKVPVLQREGR